MTIPARRPTATLLDTTAQRLPRKVERRVEAAHHRGVEAAARVNAGAYVTHVGLSLTAALSAEEARLLRQAPTGDARYGAIVDSFAGLVCNEIVRLSF